MTVAVEIPTTIEDWSAERIEALLEAHVYEDPRLDWKEDLRKDDNPRFIRNAVGMANASGGFFVFGVRDDRESRPGDRLVGIDIGRDLTHDIAQLLKAADPPIPFRVQNPPARLARSKERVIVAVEIVRGLGPHSHEGVFYLRDGSLTRPMKTEETRAMFIRREELMLKMRHLLLELASAREATISIELAKDQRRFDRLTRIDTRAVSELFAAVLPLLSDAPDLTHEFMRARAHADALMFSVESTLPLLMRRRPSGIETDADLNWDSFINIRSRAYDLELELGQLIKRLATRFQLPMPVLVERVELQNH